MPCAITSGVVVAESRYFSMTCACANSPLLVLFSLASRSKCYPTRRTCCRLNSCLQKRAEFFLSNTAVDVLAELAGGEGVGFLHYAHRVVIFFILCLGFWEAKLSSWAAGGQDLREISLSTEYYCLLRASERQ